MRDVETAVRHIGDEQRALRAATNRARVVQHFFQRDRQSAVVAEHDHAERIADEQNVHAGFIEQARGGIVVGREAGDFFIGFKWPARECDLRERMSGTVIFPLPARGATLILASGAAPGNRDAAHHTPGCYQKTRGLCKRFPGMGGQFNTAQPARCKRQAAPPSAEGDAAE